MKTVFSKTNLPAFLLLLILLPAFTSCEKDKKPSLRGDIVGEWELKSFTVDGVELKGSIVLASEMEFEAYSGSNGDFKWSINYIAEQQQILAAVTGAEVNAMARVLLAKERLCELEVLPE